MERFLLPMERAELSPAAVKVVEDFMDAWPQSELTVLHVIPDITPDTVYPYYSLIFREVARENALADRIETAIRTKYLQSYTDRIEFSCVIGHPVHAICSIANDTRVDLIILDNHNPNAIDRLLLGSVSYGVIHRAKTPVLLVKT